jgi:hypothetical protein
MKKFLPLLAAVSLLFASCATRTPLKTNYTPPSTVPVQQSVTDAQTKATSIKKHADTTGTSIAAAAAGAKTAQDRIVLLLQATKDQPTIQEMVRLVGNDLTAITLNLATAKEEIAGLQFDVQGLQATLADAQKQIATLKQQVGDQTLLLNKANENANAAMAQSDIDKANAHKFKAILIGLAVAAVAAVLFGIFRFALFAPPLLWVLLGLPTIVGVVLFFWLGS